MLVHVFDGLATWWADVSLWLTQQWFPVQFALVMVVLLPVCAGLMWLLDRVGAVAVGRHRRSGRDDSPAKRAS